MNLPDGIKHAVQMGANEVFYEWIDLHGEDPDGALESLGASYQEITTPDMFNEEQARQLVADLAAWDDGSVDASHAQRVRRFERLMCNAGIEFARGLIAEATGEGAVPDRVKPYLPQLGPLVTALEESLDEGEFDEESFDLKSAIWD
jgi:hypothetical protein